MKKTFLKPLALVLCAAVCAGSIGATVYARGAMQKQAEPEREPAVALTANEESAAPEKDETVYIASEECAIRVISPELDKIWAPRGGEAVIVLYALRVYECLWIAARAKDTAGRLIASGMAALLAFQSFANIAVATGIFPNTGLPLPFISSGLSSLLSMFIGMGVVLNVGLQRNNVTVQ